jgi:ammonium transporter Rh
MSQQHVSQRRFAAVLAIVQLLLSILYGILVRYGDSADPIKYEASKDDWHTIEGQYPSQLKSVCQILPLCNNRIWVFSVSIDIQMMLFLGFGYLMTFLRRFGYGALVLTMGVIVVSVEWGILCRGFTRMTADDYTIYVTWDE